jgi:HSP20 family protein
MSNLANRDWFSDVFDFRRDLDQIFNRLVSGMPVRSSSNLGSGNITRGLIPPINTYVDKNRNFHVQVALPGVDPKNVEVQVQGSILSIRGQQEARQETKEANYIYREMSYGGFEREIELPEGVDRDKISAEYRHGVLELTAPVAAAAMPRRIEVKGGEEAKQIAAGR